MLQVTQAQLKAHRGDGREYYSIIYRKLACPQTQKNYIQLGDLGQNVTFLLICDAIQPHLEYYYDHPKEQVYGSYTVEQVPQTHDLLCRPGASLAAEWQQP